MRAGRILVQIPAYRDRELAPTLLDLYRKAAEPDRLRVCVAWQHAEDERLPAAVRTLPGLELLDIPYTESRGCNWARALLQRRWDGEPYVLLLDSHHRFVRGWDALATGMYDGLRRAGVERPMLTTYLPAYDPAREPGARRKRPYQIYPLGRERGLLVRLTSYPIPHWTSRDGPIAAGFASLHFLLAAGRFNEDVPFDPDVYFFGDEVATSVRAFTSGYDLFHPHVVVGWHAFDRAARVAHWVDHAGWHAQHERSLAQLRRLFGGEATGAYGLGTARTLGDYEAHVMMTLTE